VSVTDKVAVVTGAAAGIGRAIAVDLASRGAHLAVSDIDADGLAQTADLVSRTGAQVHTATLDVSDGDAMNEYATELLGHYRIVNIVVNNAGIVGDTGEFLDADLSRFEQILAVNLWGVIHGTKAFLPALIASGDGNLVNISSVDGLVTMPGSSAYCTSKWAVRGFTEAVSCDLIASAAPVRVSVVHPGGIATNIAAAGIERGGAGMSAHQRMRLETYDSMRLRVSPEKAARVIVDGMVAGRPRILIGGDARLLDVVARVVPRWVPIIAAWSDKRVFRSRTGSKRRSRST
jgi:short-subunit dehydrogenase